MFRVFEAAGGAIVENNSTFGAISTYYFCLLPVAIRNQRVDHGNQRM
jgi:hypothetical protein